MPSRVEWTDTASADLDAILEYIAQNNVSAALSVSRRIRGAAARLDTMPFRGRVVPELARLGAFGFRELIVPPWRIVYQPLGDSVNVLSVLDGRRDLHDLLVERLLR